ncbi:hypothetical protein BDE02_17G089000 [Populus trichocarpa]|nr:hypothetical protein BDE02_17G089000 [Populus trichocarpa]
MKCYHPRYISHSPVLLNIVFFLCFTCLQHDSRSHNLLFEEPLNTLIEYTMHSMVNNFPLCFPFLAAR